MNEKRLKAVIRLMRRVQEKGGKIDLRGWQKTGGDLAVKTEATAHKCGTVCCVAGWIGISPDFKAAGGIINAYSGGPHFMNSFGAAAIAKYLQVELGTAEQICGLVEGGGRFNARFYGVPLRDVTPLIVAERLTKLLETGE